MIYRIWHYTGLNPDGVGGVEKHITSMSSAFRAMGHRVYIGKNPDKSFFEDNSPLIFHTHGDSIPDIRTILKYRNNWIHIAHGNTLRRALACKEYFSLSGLRGSSKDLALTQLSSYLIAVSEHALNDSRKLYFNRHSSISIKNGADVENFKVLEKICDKPVLLFVGRADDAVKNYPLLYKLCEKIHSVHEDFELHMAPGVDTSASYIKKLGKLNSLQLREEMRNTRALVLLSKYEGDALVIREAMAAGLPVIASDIRPNRETLEGYKNGFFVELNNFKETLTSVENILFKQKLLPEPSFRSWKTVALEYLAYYDNVFKK